MAAMHAISVDHNDTLLTTSHVVSAFKQSAVKTTRRKPSDVTLLAATGRRQPHVLEMMGVLSFQPGNVAFNEHAGAYLGKTPSFIILFCMCVLFFLPTHVTGGVGARATARAAPSWTKRCRAVAAANYLEYREQGNRRGVPLITRRRTNLIVRKTAGKTQRRGRPPSQNFPSLPQTSCARMCG